MKNNVVKKLTQSIKKNENFFLGDPLISSYERASKEFDELVKKGLAKKRENNLMNFMDAHLHRMPLETHATTSEKKYSRSNSKPLR